MPFQVSMVGRIDRCLLLSYRVPAASAAGMVPSGLELETYDARGERWAFWNVVVCHIEAMRPEFLPGVLGISYNHVAYRLRVRANTAQGPMSGLYFLRSDVDDGMLALGGGMVSDFKLRRSLILAREEPGRFFARVDGRVDGRDELAAARVEVDFGDPPAAPADASAAAPAADSIFQTREEARTFLKYQAMGMAPSRDGGKLRLAEVFREERDWREREVRVVTGEFAFLKDRAPGAVLELATWVSPIDYRWRLGKTVRLAGGT